jgi:glycosyltransferase involved in cell wall biosynthesis
MKIGLNLLYLIPGRSGGAGTYGLSLLHSLALLDRENEYFVFLNRESSAIPFPQSPNFHRVNCPVTAARRFFRYGWEQAVLPMYLKRLGIDLVHSLGYVMPLVTPCINLVSILDMNLRAIPEYFPFYKRAFLSVLDFFYVQSARRAQRIVTISEFSKKEIICSIGVNQDKIIVTYLGPLLEPTIRSLVDWKAMKEHYKLPDQYIVSIGGGSRHKNIVRLIEAFGTLKDSYPHALAILGHVPSDVDMPAAKAKPGMESRLLAPGYVPDEHLAPILSHAELFVLPSLYEGFGLPVLEAQQSGLPVVCSTAGSLPEVAGEGAVYFDPYSTASMANAIRRCLDDPNLLKDLREKGKENLKRFDWMKTAQLTLDAYRQAASEMRKTHAYS